MTNNQVNTVVNNNMFRYIILEDEINYDNDDYGEQYYMILLKRKYVL